MKTLLQQPWRNCCWQVPVSTADTEADKPSLQGVSSYFLVLNNLEVQEGGQTLLEQRHMKVDMELKDLGIHQSQILFKIKEMPVYGFLRLDVSPEQGPEKVSLCWIWSKGTFGMSMARFRT